MTNMFSNSLPPDLDPQRLPQHIAIIMDGNGRWATNQNLPRTIGHAQGAKTLKHILRCCQDWKITALTVYAFSTENWGRPIEEVNFLMSLCERMLRKELAEMHQQGVKINFIGDLSALPITVAQAIENSIKLTQHNPGIQFNIAMNYGSRAEITNACQQIAKQIKAGTLKPEDIDDTTIEQQLWTAGLPAPDLLIRTSGEQRLNNYLLWQLAYTELYFTDTLWVDFDRAALHQALQEYQHRQRRFGVVPKMSAA
jgi:undecaprenyl diphosphate synthase